MLGSFFIQQNMCRQTALRTATPGHAPAAKPEYSKMTSPLVSRLEAELRTIADPIEKGCLSAQLACYQARIGEFDDAELTRVELRKKFGDGHSARVSILIMCLEGLLLYFKDLDPGARDRLMRANLLSVACNQKTLVALTAAWLAHIDFNQGRFDSMAGAIAQCFEAMHADDGTASCRVSLVLGDAFSFVGQMTQARVWYEHARVTANRIGDQAAVGALTYNRAALHVASARVKRLASLLDQSEVQYVNAEVRSAVNYQYVARLASLDHLLRAASIGVLMLEEKYEEAASSISELVSSSAVPINSAELALLHADNAHCLARLGKSQQAADAAQLATSIRTDRFDADDRALIFGALSNFSATEGDAATAEKFRESQSKALDEHQKTIASLSALLDRYSAGPTKAD